MMKRACLWTVLTCLGLGCGDDGGDGRDDVRGAPGDETGRLDGGRAGDGGGDLDGGVVGDGSPLADGGAARGDGAAASSGQDLPDAELAEALLSKLIECTLLPAAIVVPADAEIRDENDRCVARCNLAAPCDDIRVFACDEVFPESAFKACLRACPTAPADGFVCGDGGRIAHIAVCDGNPDCDDASDEAACTHTCSDGSTIEDGLGIECDRTEDCRDGSDEAGCLLCEG